MQQVPNKLEIAHRAKQAQKLFTLSLLHAKTFVLSTLLFSKYTLEIFFQICF